MAKKLGIDLGSDNILICSSNNGIIVNDKSVVAIDIETKNIVEVGEKAWEMHGRTPGKIKSLRPIKKGIIDDANLTEGLITNLLKRANYTNNLLRPIIYIATPSNLTKVESKAFIELGENLGAKKVILENSSKMAALGAGMDIKKPIANMIVDIGLGSTDIAVISLNDIVLSTSIKTAGRTFNEDIKKYIKANHKLLIGDKTAETIKTTIGCAYNPEKKDKLEIKGRNLITGLPNSIEISSQEVKEAIDESINTIIKNIKNILESTPPELSADIVDKGLILTGGSSLLKGLPDLLEEQLKVSITLADNPLTTVIDGFNKYFESN